MDCLEKPKLLFYEHDSPCKRVPTTARLNILCNQGGWCLMSILDLIPLCMEFVHCNCIRLSSSDLCCYRTARREFKGDLVVCIQNCDIAARLVISPLLWGNHMHKFWHAWRCRFMFSWCFSLCLYAHCSSRCIPTYVWIPIKCTSWRAMATY